MRIGSRRRVLALLGATLRNEQLVLLVLAVATGAIAGYGAIVFRYLYLLVQGLAFGSFDEPSLADHVRLQTHNQ